MSLTAVPIRFLLSPSLGKVKEHVRAELFGRALAQRLGRPILVELAPSYEVLERELAEGRVELVWGTAEQCTHYESRARAVLRAVRAGQGSYYSALLCRASRPLTLSTLQGTRAAWVAPRSTAGYLLPTRYLTEKGHPPADTFREEHFLGTYRKALLAVLEGEADVAAIYASHPEEDTVRAYLAEHLGADERQLLPFAYTHATPADGLIITSRMSEADTATLVSVLTSLAGSTGGLEPMLGLFDSEGFVLASEATARTHAPRAVRQTDYLAAELDAEQRCLRLWTPTGRAFGRDVREAEGRPLGEALGLEAGGALAALARSARHSGGGRVEYRLEVEGETRWFAAEATLRTPTDPAREAITAVLVCDVTELRAQEERLYRRPPSLRCTPNPCWNWARTASCTTPTPRRTRPSRICSRSARGIRWWRLARGGPARLGGRHAEHPVGGPPLGADGDAPGGPRGPAGVRQGRDGAQADGGAAVQGGPARGTGLAGRSGGPRDGQSPRLHAGQHRLRARGAHARGGGAARPGPCPVHGRGRRARGADRGGRWRPPAEDDRPGSAHAVARAAGAAQDGGRHPPAGARAGPGARRAAPSGAVGDGLPAGAPGGGR
ncbi:PhnD/SsuA/transferrin family substrate-binding protein [Cystobacter fuscus]